MTQGPSPDTKGWLAADRVGATAAFLCALHCAALPFVLAALPALGLEFLADHRFERGFVMVASALALLTLWHGRRRHRRTGPLWLALPGLGLLLAGILLVDGGAVGVHSVLVTCGGLLLAAAHFVNLRFQHVHGPGCAH